MKSISTFFFALVFFLNLSAGTAPNNIITQNDTLLITNGTGEKLALFRGKVIIVDYYEGNPLKGTVNGFEEGVIVVDGESISLDSIKAIRYDKKGNRVGRIFGTGGLIMAILAMIVGLFAINEASSLGSNLDDLISFFFLIIIGMSALIVGGIWLLISLFGFISGRRKKFFFGKRFHAHLKNRN